MDENNFKHASKQTAMNAEISCLGELMSHELRAELTPVYAEFRQAIGKLRIARAVEDNQVEVCLISRSAFTDFYSLSVLQHSIDDWASRELDGLFKEALALLPEDCRYRLSVAERYGEFKAFCKDVMSRDQLDTSDWTSLAPNAADGNWSQRR